MSTLLIGILLTLSTVTIHHKILFGIRERLFKNARWPERWIVGTIVVLLLLAHIVEISLFAMGYYLIEYQLQSGQIIGEGSQGIAATLYFSFSSYTTLGMGDLYPTGALRLLAGYEGLLGLLMIGWSASFLYLEMQSHWLD